MKKVFKYKILKKYQDEIWGHLIQKKKYSYTKKVVLLNFKNFIKKFRYRIKVKYKFFRILNFNYISKMSYKLYMRKYRFIKFLNNNYKLFQNINYLVNSYNHIVFLPSYILNLGIFYKNLFFKLKYSRKKYLKNKFKFNKLFAISFLFSDTLFKFKLSIIYVIPKTFNINIKLNFKKLRKTILKNYMNFYKLSKVQYIIKKKLNLQRQKQFFYCVHIAAPEKKKKKWSLFGLKNIYYKKLSLYFGFFKVNKFLNLYNKINNIKKNAIYSFYLILEGRLETFLYRIHFLPTVYFIKRFVLFGNVFVNNIKITQNNYFLKHNQIVSLNKKLFKYIYSNLKYRLVKKYIYINYPKYIEVDYKLLVALIIKKPQYKELTQPMSFELYTSFLNFHR